MDENVKDKEKDLDPVTIQGKGNDGGEVDRKDGTVGASASGVAGASAAEFDLNHVDADSMTSQEFKESRTDDIHVLFVNTKLDPYNKQDPAKDVGKDWIVVWDETQVSNEDVRRVCEHGLAGPIASPLRGKAVMQWREWIFKTPLKVDATSHDDTLCVTWVFKVATLAAQLVERLFVHLQLRVSALMSGTSTSIETSHHVDEGHALLD